ncbi:MAG: hypothetical protein WC926_03000 [Candidatus Paceibacterota bacterium]|jgi:hypothetical protein
MKYFYQILLIVFLGLIILNAPPIDISAENKVIFGLLVGFQTLVQSFLAMIGQAGAALAIAVVGIIVLFNS